jgi:osmotically-inducible protein OsmY
MSERSGSIKPCTSPGRASVEQGIVLLDGPDGVAVAMTPEAAELTAKSLQDAAQAARQGLVADEATTKDGERK